MLRKIISIKNVGRFQDSACGGDITFARNTLIYGANGFGKSTLCAILRSLQTGEPGHIIGRKRLGSTNPPSVKILMNDGQARFENGIWNQEHPIIVIFDNNFISENVHSGDVVDKEHKRNLYRVIVGEEGVSLAEQEKHLVQQNRNKTSQLSNLAKSIQTHIPRGMKFEVFMALEHDSEIDTKISQQELTLSSIRRSATIRSRSNLEEINLPNLPSEYRAVLKKTIDDIAHDAEEHIRNHLSAHSMPVRNGNSWVMQGIDYIGETCPFCGQNIDNVSLITAYKKVFSETYRSLKSDILEVKEKIEAEFSEVALAKLETFEEKHKNGVEFWSQYCSLNIDELIYPKTIVEVMRQFRSAALSLIEQKIRDPLEVVELDEDFFQAETAYTAEKTKLNAFNYSIQEANTIINTKKAEVGNADVVSAEKNLSQLRAVKIRYGSNVASLCDEYNVLTQEKAQIEAQKNEIRQRLDEYTTNVVRPYEARINELLDAFNAGFRISETQHSYIGGVATSNYRLVINQIPVEIGGGNTPENTPSFKNTLSAGDRSTLALAFFLAHLERDYNLAEKVVVFDDPFNSQDSFRRRQTMHEIAKISQRCAQVIVLSHDVTFLKQLWAKCPQSDRKSLKLADHGNLGSKIGVIDLESACQGRTATDIDHLQAYVTRGIGEPVDIIRKMRAVLEMYLKTTYQGHFDQQEWLGQIAGKVRDAGESHPVYFIYDEINEINDYTSPYHHGENVADSTPDIIDRVELKGFARRTLRIINASEV